LRSLLLPFQKAIPNERLHKFHQLQRIEFQSFPNSAGTAKTIILSLDKSSRSASLSHFINNAIQRQNNIRFSRNFSCFQKLASKFWHFQLRAISFFDAFFREQNTISIAKFRRDNHGQVRSFVAIKWWAIQRQMVPKIHDNFTRQKHIPIWFEAKIFGQIYK
jgi:hypothetical protein